MTKLRDPIVAALLSFIITAVFMAAKKIAPFGDGSFAAADAAIQYLDFFAWEKNILSGEDSPFFSFNKGLGGPSFAVFSYYLASPVNLLLLFFPYEKIVVFYHAATAIKLALGAFFAALWLGGRFSLKSEWKIILATGFSLSSWPLRQLCNLMWLDAVYLLPLVMLFIYRYEKGKSPIPLVMVMALSIIINWYQGLLLLMFAFILSVIDHVWFLKENADMRETLQFGAKMAGFIVAAVILSLPVLAPTLSALSLGRGGADWADFGFHLFGSPYKLLTGILPGQLSAKGELYYYGGEVMMLSMLAFFFKIRGRKLMGGVALIAVIYLMYYWQPFYFLFSLLKRADTYHYRYGLFATFAAMFLAAHFLNTVTLATRKRLLIAALAMPLLFSHVAHITKTLILSDGAKIFENYAKNEREAVKALKEKDGGLYRTAQTNALPIYCDEKFTIPPRANYNEGLAYGYGSLESYTSSPDNRQLLFLDYFGYKKNGENFNIYATPLLPSDSLLGVKYVRSSMDIEGLELVGGLKEANKKRVYLNPYAMPMVFCHDKLLTEFVVTENPMENTNYVFQNLFNETVYVEIAAKKRELKNDEISKIVNTGGVA